MQTAVISFDSSGRSYSWSANYPQGGIELCRTAFMIRRAKKIPYIQIGRDMLSEKAEKVLKGYTALVNRQGFESREQAEYGARVGKKSAVHKRQR